MDHPRTCLTIALSPDDPDDPGDPAKKQSSGKNLYFADRSRAVPSQKFGINPSFERDKAVVFLLSTQKCSAFGDKQNRKWIDKLPRNCLSVTI